MSPADLAHTAVLEELRGRLPDGVLSTDPDLLAGHQVDLTGRFAGTAAALARPRDRDEVVAIVAACAAHGLPLVPQGGNTGMVGGGVPRDGELVLSLTRLDALGEVDVAAGQILAGAGVTLERVQEKARAAGFEFPLDFAARASATVGGAIATDAGGALALAHGTMRRRVVGLEAVLGDGSVVDRMAGLLKDNAGYDLPALLIGSEGTLGIVTAARLQLEPAKPLRTAALFGVGSLAAGLELLAALRRRPRPGGRRLPRLRLHAPGRGGAPRREPARLRAPALRPRPVGGATAIRSTGSPPRWPTSRPSRRSRSPREPRSASASGPAAS